MSSSSSRTIHIEGLDAIAVVAAMQAAWADVRLDAVLFFCSPHFDLPALAAGMASTFKHVPCVVGCTSAGQIGASGFVQGGLTAVGFFGQDVIVTPWVVEPLSTSLERCSELALAVAARRRKRPALGAFGLMLVDGLAHVEEKLTAALYAVLGDIPLVGGSAGDDLTFTRTSIYIDGTFGSDRAVFMLFETVLPFSAFKFQHFVATEDRLVVTKADPTARIIQELNGLPALEAYAAVLGLRPDQVTSKIWSKHPVLVTIDGEDYIRSFQRVYDDGSFGLLCAIDEGLVLRIGSSVDPMGVAEAAFEAASREVHGAQLMLACDCILRRLEFEGSGLLDAMGTLMAKHAVIGFSTYGEQWNGIHVNQTFTGIALGHRDG